MVRSVSAEPAWGSDIDTATINSPRQTPGHDPLTQRFAGEALDGADRPDTGFEHRKGERGGALAKLLQHQQRFQVAETETAVAGRRR